MHLIFQAEIFARTGRVLQTTAQQNNAKHGSTHHRLCEKFTHLGLNYALPPERFFMEKLMEYELHHQALLSSNLDEDDLIAEAVDEIKSQLEKIPMEQNERIKTLRRSTLVAANLISRTKKSEKETDRLFPGFFRHLADNDNFLNELKASLDHTGDPGKEINRVARTLPEMSVKKDIKRPTIRKNFNVILNPLGHGEFLTFLEGFEIYELHENDFSKTPKDFSLFMTEKLAPFKRSTYSSLVIKGIWSLEFPNLFRLQI